MVTGTQIYIIRVRDFERALKLYRDGLGLAADRVVESRMAQLAIPGGGHFEITVSDELPPAPTPTDRRQAASSIVFSVDDMAATLASAVKHGATVINQPFALGARQIAYIADAEGNVVGFSAGS